MKIGFAIILVSVFNLSFAQGKYDANWCFGIMGGINFVDTSNPTNFQTLCNEDYASASISDSLGNLLFYIAPDSFYQAGDYGRIDAIYNSNNKIVANGDSINEGVDLNAVIILPIPDSSNAFYIFYTNDQHEFPVSLYYSTIVDNNGELEVVNKNQVMPAGPFEWKMAAVRHANGSDWWLLLHQSNADFVTDTFYEYLITKDSILGPFKQAIGSEHFSYIAFYGQMKFSKNGNWLAICLGDQNSADLFHFNRCTGQLEDFIALSHIDTTVDTTDINSIYGCEFSEDESKLYIGEGTGGNISTSALYQYSLNDSDIGASKVKIFQTDSAQTTFGDLLRAPDNKIYQAIIFDNESPYDSSQYNKYSQYLWVINSPDSFGAACNFQPYSYFLGNNAHTYVGLVNMPNYNLAALSIYQGNGWDTTICNTQSVTIGNPPIANVSYAWQPVAGITNTALAQQTIKPDTSTWYYVTLTDTTINYSCQSVTDSFFVQVIVCCDTALLQQVSLSKDTFVCKGDTEGVILTANTVPGISFNWQAAPGISNTTLAQQAVNPTQSTWYYVTFTDSSLQGICATKTDSVYVGVKVCCDSLLLSQCTLSKDTFICTNIDTPTKGAILLVDTVPGVSYTWQPAAGISVHLTQQIVDPSQSTWYYVTFFSDTDSSSACNQRKDSVYVEVKKCMVGIDEINLASQRLNIYPNPAQNIAVVEWQPVNEKLEVSVTDLLGREIQFIKVDGITGTTQLDISALANGLYVVKVLSPADGGVGGGSGKLTVIK